jgi:hypothetical protein
MAATPVLAVPFAFEALGRRRRVEVEAGSNAAAVGAGVAPEVLGEDEEGLGRSGARCVGGVLGDPGPIGLAAAANGVVEVKMRLSEPTSAQSVATRRPGREGVARE